ncbi:hypothetical protein HDU92_007420 [Lobulomyces angularis]|nr:hypothetical protein HDU92_007420 [Lobulomyces angularis]
MEAPLTPEITASEYIEEFERDEERTKQLLDKGNEFLDQNSHYNQNLSNPNFPLKKFKKKDGLLNIIKPFLKSKEKFKSDDELNGSEKYPNLYEKHENTDCQSSSSKYPTKMISTSSKFVPAFKHSSIDSVKEQKYKHNISHQEQILEVSKILEEIKNENLNKSKVFKTYSPSNFIPEVLEIKTLNPSDERMENIHGTRAVLKSEIHICQPESILKKNSAVNNDINIKKKNLNFEKKSFDIDSRRSEFHSKPIELSRKSMSAARENIYFEDELVRPSRKSISTTRGESFQLPYKKKFVKKSFSVDDLNIFKRKSKTKVLDKNFSVEEDLATNIIIDTNEAKSLSKEQNLTNSPENVTRLDVLKNSVDCIPANSNIADGVYLEDEEPILSDHYMGRKKVLLGSSSSSESTPKSNSSTLAEDSLEVSYEEAYSTEKISQEDSESSLTILHEPDKDVAVSAEQLPLKQQEIIESFPVINENVKFENASSEKFLTKQNSEIDKVNNVKRCFDTTLEVNEPNQNNASNLNEKSETETNELTEAKDFLKQNSFSEPRIETFIHETSDLMENDVVSSVDVVPDAILENVSNLEKVDELKVSSAVSIDSQNKNTEVSTANEKKNIKVSKILTSEAGK